MSEEAVDVGEFFQPMKEEAQRDMLGEGFEPANVNYETHAGVSLEDNPQTKAYLPLSVDEVAKSDEITARGEEKLSQTGSRDQGRIVWDTIRMKATAPTPHPELTKPNYDGPYNPKSTSSSRSVWTGEIFENVPVYEAGGLTSGDLIVGPAIIESEFTTIFVTHLRDAQVDGANNMVLVSKKN